MNGFKKQRLPLGSQFEDICVRYLKTFHELEVIETNKIKDNFETELDPRFWKNDSFKKVKPLQMLRWLPDLLVVNKKNSIGIFFDIKLMYTPVYYPTLQDEINKNFDLNIHKLDIGNIEREAYDSYQSWFLSGSKVAIFALCTFQKDQVFCEYANNLKILYRDERERNTFSAGSTTPRVNFDIKQLRKLNIFLEEELKINIDDNNYEKLLSYLESTFSIIGKPSRINHDIATSTLDEITNKTGRKVCFLNLN